VVQEVHPQHLGHREDPLSAIYPPYITPDGTAYAYSHGEWLQDLYLVEGLRF
jgi:hypothetical protein